MKVQHKRGDVPIVLLVLQVILPFAPVLHLEKNDLFDPQAMPLLHALRWLPTPVYRMFGVCCIPMVKRLFSTLSRAAFFMLFSYIALLKPCGQLHTVHWVGGIWTCSLASARPRDRTCTLLTPPPDSSRVRIAAMMYS